MARDQSVSDDELLAMIDQGWPDAAAPGTESASEEPPARSERRAKKRRARSSAAHKRLAG